MTKSPEWHRHGVLYVAYPNSFGTGFETLERQIPRLSKLGVTAIHILPFLTSPRRDGGFDIADYYTVDPHFGGEDAFERFRRVANDYQIHLFMDLVLNHVSEAHPWFIRAISGDEEARAKFVVNREKPKFLRKEIDADGVWAWYQGNGEEFRLRIIFPEQVGEVPHWRQAEDGYWYYHSFYPSQLDLNWKNPSVFEEMIKVIEYWGTKGMSFRLDAIPFIGKEIESGVTESGPRTFPLLEALTQAAHIVAPDSVFLVEANQPVDQLVAYLGKEAPLCQLAYQFPLTTSLFEFMVTGEVSSLSQVLRHQRLEAPDWGQFVTFLRSHDELSLEYESNQTRKVLRDALEPRGLPFREGFGISGRSRDFCETMVVHILMHGLLLSLPGIPALYYGDELGLTNNWGMVRAAQLAKSAALGELPPIDTRDLHRGPVLQSDMTTPEAKLIQHQLGLLLAARREHLGYIDLHPELVPHEPGLLELKYHQSSTMLRVVLNLSQRSVVMKATKPKEIIRIGMVVSDEHTVSVAPESLVWWIEDKVVDNVA